MTVKNSDISENIGNKKKCSNRSFGDAVDNKTSGTVEVTKTALKTDKQAGT